MSGGRSGDEGISALFSWTACQRKRKALRLLVSRRKTKALRAKKGASRRGKASRRTRTVWRRTREALPAWAFEVFDAPDEHCGCGR